MTLSCSQNTLGAPFPEQSFSKAHQAGCWLAKKFHIPTLFFPLSGGRGVGPQPQHGDVAMPGAAPCPHSSHSSLHLDIKGTIQSQLPRLGLRSSTQSGKTQMEPEAVTDGQSTQRPSQGSTGSKCSICCCPAQTRLEDEEDKEEDEDDEDKEEDENDGSRCQHSRSSPPQRVRKV